MVKLHFTSLHDYEQKFKQYLKNNNIKTFVECNDESVKHMIHQLDMKNPKDVDQLAFLFYLLLTYDLFYYE